MNLRNPLLSHITLANFNRKSTAEYVRIIALFRIPTPQYPAHTSILEENPVNYTNLVSSNQPISYKTTLLFSSLNYYGADVQQPQTNEAKMEHFQKKFNLLLQNDFAVENQVKCNFHNSQYAKLQKQLLLDLAEEPKNRIYLLFFDQKHFNSLFAICVKILRSEKSNCASIIMQNLLNFQPNKELIGIIIQEFSGENGANFASIFRTIQTKKILQLLFKMIDASKLKEAVLQELRSVDFSNFDWDETIEILREIGGE
ncbi:hypothetical protein SS50377_28061 [Spironucleus salmonicida]|uniref:Uncharacterized protein n=1 Tax=Spironucleus salmonicida TaxID=348837 RepID=V6LEB0_9EUKA|nr:hypothetical protein SS50377_28061 [Spironucleus salmonicida]|eukprot:EST42613.1 Hypothetical protein SS50377_17933 [Spironucleus salmonicida]